MPWAWGRNSIEKPSGVYHLVWSRDLYQVASAQLAAGDRAAAERALDFLLFRQQKPDGSFPQNSEVDGSEHWTQIQMDQIGLPIVLAWQLGRTDARSIAQVRLAGEYLVKHGPLTGQERWENQRGWSPATIAAEIAGLVTGADLLRRTGDPATAARWEATADAWQRSVQAWTATTNGPLSAAPYYLRVTKDRAPNRATTYDIGDSGPGAADQRRVVDPSFLELVRLGVKPATDPAIENTVRVVDDQLEVTSRAGTFWRRFSFDGYGETSTGAPWEIGKPDTYETYGRAWPLLAGERGEYELASGRAATQELASMAAAATTGLMLPEQVWDGRPPSSGTAFTPGKGTASATPLAWSHAQFVRLALSIDAGAPIERPAIVACRYAVVCRGLPSPDAAT
jgi:glucoamylase